LGSRVWNFEVYLFGVEEAIGGGGVEEVEEAIGGGGVEEVEEAVGGGVYLFGVEETVGGGRGLTADGAGEDFDLLLLLGSRDHAVEHVPVIPCRYLPM
jgi:hypothetical protein